jgi:cytidine deaminase
MQSRAERAVRLKRSEKMLIASALEASRNAYAPYSRFEVGAALLAQDGEIFTGCNVENASYGATLCAERNAVTAAVCAGYKDFSAIAIVTSSSPPAPPCGLCLQVLVEFCSELSVLLANPEGEVVRTKLSKLLPRPFSPHNI